MCRVSIVWYIFTAIIFHFFNLASLEFTLVLAAWWTSRLRAGMAARSGELVVPNAMELAPVRLRTGMFELAAWIVVGLVQVNALLEAFRQEQE